MMLGAPEGRRTLAQMVSGFQEIPGGVPVRETYHKRADPDRDWWINQKNFGFWRHTNGTSAGIHDFPESSLVHKLVDSDHSRRVFHELVRQGHGFAEGMLDPRSLEMAERYQRVMKAQPPAVGHTPRTARSGPADTSTPRAPGTSRPLSAPPMRRPVAPQEPAPQARRPHPPGGRGGRRIVSARGNQTGPLTGRAPARPSRPRAGAPPECDGGRRANSARSPRGAFRSARPGSGRRYQHIVQGVGGVAWVA